MQLRLALAGVLWCMTLMIQRFTRSNPAGAAGIGAQCLAQV